MMRRFMSKRRTERREHLRERLEQARADFDKIVRHIIHEYEPIRVYQWGSLVSGETFQDISDIDIAVEGIEDSAFLRMVDDCERLSRFPLHIVRLEDIRAVHRENIIREGVLVHGRPLS